MSRVVVATYNLHGEVHSSCIAYKNTVHSGYQAHALVGTLAKIYALHNEVRYIVRVKG